MRTFSFRPSLASAPALGDEIEVLVTGVVTRVEVDPVDVRAYGSGPEIALGEVECTITVTTARRVRTGTA